MGKESTTVLLTFAGPKVPHYVRLYGAEHRCTLHKKTVPVCSVCYEVGHRNTACPRPGACACPECGTRDPAPGHACVAKCSLCSGDHITGARGCPKRFVTPYIIRHREREQQQQEQYRKRTAQKRRTSRDRTPGCAWRDRSVSPGPRRGSSTSGSSSRQTSRSGSRPRNETPTRSSLKQVGWTDQSPIAIESQSQFPPLGHGNKKQCGECEQLKSQIASQAAQIEKQNEMIKSLLSRMEAMEGSKEEETGGRRKIAKRETQSAQPQQTEDANTPTKEDPAWVQPMREISKAISQLTNQMSQLAAQVAQIASKGDKLEANVGQLMLEKKTKKKLPYAPSVGSIANTLSLNQDGPAF